MTEEYDYDLFVIGAGSGGVRAARMAASAGAKVAIAEEKYLGGTCVNVGCVPKKLFVYASHWSEEFVDAAGFGWELGEHRFNWSTLLQRKNKEIERLNGIYQNLLENAGVTIVWGRARLTSANSIEVDGKTITAQKILVTVGAMPSVPEFPGSEHVISSDQVFYLPELPKKIVIVGGGYIAVEFAGIMNGLGVETHLIYRGDKLLKNFDQPTAQFAAKEMQKKGVNIHYSTNITKIDRQSDGSLSCSLDNGQSIVAGQVMYATGRRSLTNDLGIEKVGLMTRNNATIETNEQFQTSIPSIYALGDVIGTLELTPVATAQAMVFVNQQYGDGTRTISYDNIPTAIFCQPNIGTVGLSEEALKAKGVAVDVYQSEFKHLKHTLSGSDERVLMRMLVDKGTQKVLGMHMVGPDAGEVIQGFAVAVKASLTKDQFDATIGIHPTMAEEFVTLRDISYSV